MPARMEVPNLPGRMNLLRRNRASAQQSRYIRDLVPELFKRALSRRLVWPPAQERSTVAKAFATEMVIGHFDDELGFQRTPLRRSVRGPATWATGCVASEAGLGDERFEPLRQSRLVLTLDRRGETDMV